MLSDDRINNNLMLMAGLPPHYYRTHPAGNGGGGRGRMGHGPPGRPSPAGGPPDPQAVILHPALFGPTVRQTRPMPNLLPRYAAPPYLHGPPPGGQALPPPGGHPNDPFIEEQVEMLAEKIEGLEGELRYAWRALDVLSQEYVKMWQRLEKMEGLLSEQQTVITQLIDLYSADSSDNGTNGLKSGAASPSSVATGISKSGQQLPDENFYKALNAMHGDANTEMQLALSASQSMDDFIRYIGNSVLSEYSFLLSGKWGLCKWDIE